MIDPNFDPLTELQVTQQRVHHLESLVNEMITSMSHNAQLLKALIDAVYVTEQKLQAIEIQVRTRATDKIK
jgi:hypothetical protein